MSLWWSIWVTFYHQSTRYLVPPACWWPLMATSISAWFTLRWCQPWNLISKTIFQIKKSIKTKESWGKHIHTEYLWRLIQRGPTSTSHGTRLSPHPPHPTPSHNLSIPAQFTPRSYQLQGFLRNHDYLHKSYIMTWGLVGQSSTSWAKFNFTQNWPLRCTRGWFEGRAVEKFSDAGN